MSFSMYHILFLGKDSSQVERTREMLSGPEEPAFTAISTDSLKVGLAEPALKNVDALIVDLNALDGKGLENISQINDQKGAPPIIALISRSQEELGEHALHAGAAEYLVKETLSEDLLRRAVRYVIERRQAEDTIRTYEEQLEELFENAKDILFTLDLHGNITSLNKATEEVMGWTKEEALHKNIKNFVAPEHFHLCGQMMQQVLNEEPLQHFEITLVRKDGRKVLLEASARLIYSDGKVEGVRGAARDVTERRHLESMVRQSQKLEAVGRLSGGLAHDFNNLLCVISGHTEILAAQLAPTHAAVKSITQIKKAADSAAALTRQLLAFSRKQIFHPRTLDLNAIVADTEKLIGRLIGEDIEVATALHANLGHVRVDPVQVEQVLINLVINARDAMPQGGKLTIETSNTELDEDSPSRREIVPPGRYVVVSVTDTGYGMDEETLSRVFEPFYTTKELGKGTGLGLATVYGIVKQSGGFIWVYSEPGQGATFKIYFPRVDSALTDETQEVRDLEIRQGTETVLLVENAEPLRALAKEFLKSSGYAVLEAENGKEALRIANSFGSPIQLLLTDVVMPGINGRQLAEQLTSVRPATKVLYMSGYPNEGITQSGILNSGVVFLEKPFTREILLRKVRQVLDDLPQAT